MKIDRRSFLSSAAVGGLTLAGLSPSLSNAAPDERPKARADAAAYDALRDRLLSLLARRELELGLDEAEASD